MIIAEFEKAPASKLDFSMNWTPWLTAGDAISTATWTAATGITISSSPTPSLSANVATLWLEGGTAGVNYTVTCAVVTTGGRTDERSIQIQVR